VSGGAVETSSKEGSLEFGSSGREGKEVWWRLESGEMGRETPRG
jgi:hypothetical protein